MKKNVAGQKIGCQMVTALDGSAFTGSVTVYVTGNAGTQAVGSVGSGACTHEGNGYHTYAPAQAESNYDLIAFTFVGTGAVPASMQVYTSFPQTTDNMDAAAVRAAVGLASANLDTQIGTLATGSLLSTVASYIDTEVAAIKAKTDNLPAAPAAVGDIPTATQNADTLLNRDMSAVSDTTARSPLMALRFLRNKWDVSGATLTVKKEDDSTTAWTATVTAAPGADPISGSDPA